MALLRRIEAAATVLGFALILLLPMIESAFGFDPMPELKENRTRAQRPEVRLTRSSIASFAGKFEKYFNDNLGMRDTLVQARNVLLARVLRVSSNPDVLIGKDGWLFLASEGKVEYFQASEPYTDEQLERWRQILKHNASTLEARGIRYAFVVAPNKETIYPEKMPDHVRKIGSRSRLDQLAEYMKREPTVNFVDVRSNMLAEKEHHLLYGRTDTHWNGIGAHVAYRGIINAVQKWYPEMRPYSLESFPQTEVKRYKFGLLVMLGLENVSDEHLLLLLPGAGMRARAGEIGLPVVPDRLPPERRPSVWEVPDETLPRALVLHDSFGDFFHWTLTQHFERTAFYHYWYFRNPDTRYESVLEIIEREKPDVVIQELVERALQVGVNIDPF